MSRAHRAVVVISLVVGSSVSGFAQSVDLPRASSPSSSVTTVPRLVRVTSTFVPANGLPPAPVETVTLGIYAEATGGTPLWQETQTVAVDADGRYSLLLGATLPEGLPLELFAVGDARWLGRRFERPGEGEQARVLLASVPYALKASDADTLGGKPPSAYLLAEPSGSSGEPATSSGSTSPSTAKTSTTASALPLSAGTVNYVGKFVNATDLGNSAIYDAGGLVGVNTTAPLDILHARFTNTTGTMTGYAVQNLGNTATSYSGMLFYDQNGALGQFQGFNNSTHEYRINNVASFGTINFMIAGNSKLKIGNTGDIAFNGSDGVGPTSALLRLPATSSIGLGRQVLGNTGFGNTALGALALVTAGTGGENTGVGAFALEQITTGQNNTAIGYSAGFEISVGSNNIEIGSVGLPNDNGVIRIGEPGTQLGFFAGGIRGIPTARNDAIPVLIDSAGQLGTLSSSRRFKEDIHDMGDASRAIFALRPVTFRYSKAYTDGAKPLQYGLVAEEVAKVFPALAVFNADGGVDTVHYETLSVLLLNEVQKQQQRIEALERRLDALVAKPE